MLEIDDIDPQNRKIKQDTAKFVAERLGKDRGYATRTEQTGKDGEPISIQAITGMKIIKEDEKLLDGTH